jgi:hypothetical protein
MTPAAESHSSEQKAAKAIQEAQWVAAEENLRDKLGKFATQSRFEDEFVNAFLEFWGVDDPEELPVDLEEETPEFLLSLEWYLYDYEESESGRRIIDLFAEIEAPRLPSAERQLLELWQKTTLAPYEVIAVSPHQGYRLLQVMSGKEVAVDDAPTSEELKPGDLVVTRLLPVGESMRPSSVFRTFTPADLPRLRATVLEWFSDYERQNPGAEWDSFFRDQGYLFNDYTLERQALAERMTQAPDDAMGGTVAAEEDVSEEVDEVEISVVRLEQQYKQWLDRPTPALGGLTPRQAVKSKDSRRRVIEIVREMGEIEASYAMAGEPAVEMHELLPALGLKVGDLRQAS